ncbi:MAG: SUMF1/EgtB/PvdO family nonheme iron enzyme [Gemmataceae bacterium]
MGVNPSHFSPSGQAADTVRGRDVRRHPVENVAWFDAVGFCLQLTDLPAERAAGRVYRLPTEVEWEYACRGGVSLQFPFPYGRTITTRVANYRDNARQRSSSRRRHTTPVGSYPPNGFGLHDMVGNIWEWCLDWYSSTSYATHPPVDPPGPPEGERRNARGGTYNLETRRVRSADRSSFEPEQRDSDLGFRVLCEWGPTAG